MTTGGLETLLDRALLLASLAVPLAAALVLCLPGGGRRRVGSRLAAWAALPALACALLGVAAPLDLPWLLLGSRIGLDGTGRVFLALTAALWLVAGIYSLGYLCGESGRRRYFVFFSLSMLGNLGLVVALDAVSFFAFFTLMSVAAYGLVVHERSAQSLRAGRVYMVLVIVGEFLLLTALVGLSAGGAPMQLPIATLDGRAPWVVALLIVGFGIKLGALPLHVWLPLAHPAAPTPASAVLSGAMIKAGLLGWMRFLPIGSEALPDAGLVLVLGGLLAAFYGVLIGVTQRNPKTVLAYSSVSQMGYVTVAVGVGLIAPDAWPAVGAAVAVFVVHHGIAKASLFLGVGAVAAAERPAGVVLALALPALALAGAPLSSGAIAKLVLEQSLRGSAIPQAAWIPALLTLAAVGTTALMARFLVRVRALPSASHPLGRPGWLAWAGSLVAVAGSVYLLPHARGAVSEAAQPGLVLGFAWPIGAGVLIAWLVWRCVPALPARLSVPEGDWLEPMSRLARELLRRWRAAAPRGRFEAPGMSFARRLEPRLRRVGTALLRAEAGLCGWLATGITFLATILVLCALYSMT